MTPKLLVRDVSEYNDLPAGIEKIEDVFIFDDEVRVHLCSLEGYLECEHIYTVLHFADDLDDEAREALDDTWGHNDLDFDYFSPNDPRIVDLSDKYDNDGDDEWEDIVDDYRCNHAY